MAEEIKLKKIEVMGYNTGEFIQKVLDKINDGYKFDQHKVYKIGYAHYAEMELGETEEVKPVKKAKAKAKAADKAE